MISLRITGRQNSVSVHQPSLDTVKSNAEEFKVDYMDEFYRVIIHGVLHLCGQNDKSDEERAEMIRKENAALAMIER